MASKAARGAPVGRREFLTLLAVATMAGATACAPEQPIPGAASTTPERPPLPAEHPPAPAPATLLPPPPASARVGLPGGGSLTTLPARGDLLAFTVDDGTSSDVVRMYTQFAQDTGMRLTYFLNGQYPSWTDNADLIRPLVESGQVQLGNHTWSHPNLTRVSRSRIAEELTKNDRFVQQTYGVSTAPYFRPPYGSHNATVDSIAANLGFTVPTLWNGSLADSTVITEDYLVKMAQEHFTPQSIVLGHLNHLPVTHVYPQLVEIIRSRNLRTVTFNDVFAMP